MADFSTGFMAGLSVVEGFRDGGFGFRDLSSVDPFAVDWEFILFSDFIASFVENIRVSRLVIDGFSGCDAWVDDFCGSDGGAA